MSEATTKSTTLTPHLVCRNAGEAIGFYERAFGARTLFAQRMPDGSLMHATLDIDGAQLFLTDECPDHGGFSPQALGNSPVTLALYVADCDAVYNRAVDAGCTAIVPLADMFWGDRWGMLVDPYGHKWSVATHQRQVSPDEIQKALDEMVGAPA